MTDYQGPHDPSPADQRRRWLDEIHRTINHEGHNRRLAILGFWAQVSWRDTGEPVLADADYLKAVFEAFRADTTDDQLADACASTLAYRPQHPPSYVRSITERQLSPPRPAAPPGREIVFRSVPPGVGWLDPEDVLQAWADGDVIRVAHELAPFNGERQLSRTHLAVPTSDDDGLRTFCGMVRTWDHWTTPGPATPEGENDCANCIRADIRSKVLLREADL